MELQSYQIVWTPNWFIQILYPNDYTSILIHIFLLKSSLEALIQFV